MASLQSEVLSHPEQLQQRLVEANAYLQAQPQHVEAGWRVYAVAAEVVEFWQGASDCNHIRWRGEPAADGQQWNTARLWP